MAKSRRNMLERLERVEAVATEKSSGNFYLKKVERAGVNVLSVEDLAIGYGEKVLGRDINFTLTRGECLGIIGGNGTGKTTFLKTILGKHRELAGKINWGTKTEIGYYSQQLEDLDKRNEIIQELRRVAPLAENGALRSFLARFLFFGEEIFKRVGDLSGGEKGRLALAKLIYSDVNVLVLDEPTNHLDIPSREALEAALQSYAGTIFAVSHDRYFLDQIATQIFSFEADGTIEIFDGNYSEFHEWKERKEAEKGKKGERENEQLTAGERIIEDQIPNTEDQRSKIELSKNQLQKIEQRIKKIEEEILFREDEMTRISFEMNLPEIASNHQKLQAVTEKFQTAEKQIQTLYDEWDRLAKEVNA